MSKKHKSAGAKSPAKSQKAAGTKSVTTVVLVLCVGIVIAASLGAYLIASAQGSKSASGVQKASVAVTNVYSPSTVELKAGAPAEITFSRGQGCTSIVKSQALGFHEDLSTGPRTVHLPALQPGTYDFECGMNMVHGTIVVR